MMESEQIVATESSTHHRLGPVLFVSNRDAARSKIVPFVSAHGPELVPRKRRAKAIGRKGRQELARRRALDGAFLAVAMGVVALLWWTTL